MSLESAAIKMSAHHPFRSAKAKERYLKLYDMRAKEWPVASETRMVNTAYGPTFVRVSGPASTPPLVLLHGVSGNSLQWMPNIRDLSRGFRVYAVDNICDYGRSVYTRIIKNSDDYNEKLYSAQKAIQRLHSLHKTAPHIEAEVIPKAGHDLTFVQAELVNRKVVDFLERPDRR
jgi:pimeloyl-ACP methyl ester carboxylesterase